MSSIKGVCHLSRRAKTRLYCKLQLWMWRKRREKCRFAIFRTKKQAGGISSSSCLSVKAQPRKNNGNTVSPLGCDAGHCLDDTLRKQNSLLKLCRSGSASEKFAASSSSQNVVTDVGNAATAAATMPSPKRETLAHLNELKDPLKRSHTVKPLLSIDSDACGLTTHFKEPKAEEPSQSFEVDGALGQLTPAPPGQDQAADVNTDERATRKQTTSFKTDASLNVLTKDIHGRFFFHLF